MPPARVCRCLTTILATLCISQALVTSARSCGAQAAGWAARSTQSVNGARGSACTTQQVSLPCFALRQPPCRAALHCTAPPCAGRPMDLLCCQQRLRHTVLHVPWAVLASLAANTISKQNKSDRLQTNQRCNKATLLLNDLVDDLMCVAHLLPQATLMKSPGAPTSSPQQTQYRCPTSSRQLLLSSSLALMARHFLLLLLC